jgi:hypothetical protein
MKMQVKNETVFSRWARFLGDSLREISARTGIAYGTVVFTLNLGKTSTVNMRKIAADLYVPVEAFLTVDPLDPFAVAIATDALIKCARRRMLPKDAMK